MADRKLNLLSLDGGGVRGLSSLFILKQIMESIDRENPPKPCEYFNLIGGSGSGGLIAILLGRLRMDIDQCIKAYSRLLKQVFSRRRLPISSSFRLRSRYDVRRIEFAMRSLLRQLGFDENMLLRDADTSCRVFVCVTDSSARKMTPLTSYASKYTPNELYKTTRVWEAAQASFATTSLFDPVPIGPSHRLFHDSTMEANNPIREVWIEARGVWSAGSLESQLRCMVSIGTGVPSIKRGSRTLFGLSKGHDDVVDTEAETNKFIQEHTELDDEGRLFRFDVPNGLVDIGADGVDEREVVVDATVDYLAKEVVYKQVRRCGRALDEM